MYLVADVMVTMVVLDISKATTQEGHVLITTRLVNSCAVHSSVVTVTEAVPRVQLVKIGT